MKSYLLINTFLLIILTPLTRQTFADQSQLSYYINANQGNDLNNGLSPQKPWKSLWRVNNEEFHPGDKILFRAGTQYEGRLAPQGSGALVNDKPVPIIIDKYGEGKKPHIAAEGKHRATLYLHNVEYWEVRNLELSNKGETRQARRLGVYLHLQDFGTAHHIRLTNLHIHDVNGSTVKKEGGGWAIYYRNEGKNKKSRFDGLLIENCHIQRVERSAIGGSGYSRRNDWYPNLNFVVRRNLIEQVPGDGIVPNSCDGALVEHNIMRDCTRMVEDAAAGIWPWSSDNTIIQFNEVSDHKAAWDAQGFDSDWNCRNTIIQYNYSHDNEGGFLLICNKGDAGMPGNIGNIGTIIRFNISINDGFRARKTHKGIFSPTFHISGPCKDTLIYNNTIYIGKKPGDNIDRTLIEMDNWGGPWPINTTFYNNLFIAEEPINNSWGKAKGTTFSNNAFSENIKQVPDKSLHFNPKPYTTLSSNKLSREAAIKALRSPIFRTLPDKGVSIPNNGGLDFSGTPLPKNKLGIGALLRD